MTASKMEYSEHTRYDRIVEMNELFFFPCYREMLID